MGNTYITVNVHIEYHRGHSTCGVSPVKAHCAAAVLPVVRSPQRMLSIWQALAVQVLIFMGQMQQLWQCRRGVTARIDSLKDFHLQWKIEYKSGFIGNNYKKVVYLGKEVYDTPACSLV